jgi:hypothetical protein
MPLEKKGSDPLVRLVSAELERHGMGGQQADNIAADVRKKVGLPLAHDKDSGKGILPRSIRQGAKVEMEHTTKPPVARQIAIDHLRESPDYYTRLKKVEGEKRAFKLQGHRTVHGMRLAIENKKGSIRKWYDPHGKEAGSTTMCADYGYIVGTTGSDKEEIDCYIGEDESAKEVYVVDQMKKPDFKKFDEQKCMIGFPSAEAAKACYIKQYDNPKFFGGMKAMPIDEFKSKLNNEGKKVASYAAAQRLVSKAKDLGVPITHEGLDLFPHAEAFYAPTFLKPLRDLADKINPGSFPITPGAIHIPGGASAPKSGVLAHELGHAIADKELPTIAKLEAGGKLLTTPVVGGVLGAAAGASTPEKDNRTDLLSAGATGAAAALPIASSEGQAWHRGARLLREAGGDMADYHALNRSNMLAQVAPKVAPAMLGWAVGKGARSLHDRTKGRPEKVACGDMIQYFQDHPDKLKAKKERDMKKSAEDPRVSRMADRIDDIGLGVLGVPAAVSLGGHAAHAVGHRMVGAANPKIKALGGMLEAAGGAAERFNPLASHGLELAGLAAVSPTVSHSIARKIVKPEEKVAAFDLASVGRLMRGPARQGIELGGHTAGALSRVRGAVGDLRAGLAGMPQAAVEQGKALSRGLHASPVVPGAADAFRAGLHHPPKLPATSPLLPATSPGAAALDTLGARQGLSDRLMDAKATMGRAVRNYGVPAAGLVGLGGLGLGYGAVRGGQAAMHALTPEGPMSIDSVQGQQGVITR